MNLKLKGEIQVGNINVRVTGMKKVFEARKLNEIAQKEKKEHFQNKALKSKEMRKNQQRRGEEESRGPKEVLWGLKSLLAAQTTMTFQNQKS